MSPHQETSQRLETLEQYLQQQTGQDVRIQSITALAGGASRESWKIDAVFDGTPQTLALRKDLPTTMNKDALTRSHEYHLMKAAHEHGVKVPKVRWLCEDETVLGAPFFLMDYVEGTSIGRKVMTQPELAEARQKLPQQMAEQLAHIHTLGVLQNPQFDFLQRPDNKTPAQSVVSSTFALIDQLAIHNPTLEFAMRWCDHHQPPSDRVTFLHGDFRIGNLLVDEHGLAAVIDWEFAHIGDPVEEIGYLCMRDWRFGRTERAAGLASRDDFLKLYEQYSGHTVDAASADWWEIMGNIRWAVICLSQAQRHLSGEDPSVELASLGRRSSEMQLEALRLIEHLGIQLKQ
jgi:aminoglycoside phosphotransferase (APT) family kinase protein